MLSRDEIINKAHELDFEDIGFTTAEPFESQREILKEREAEYAWTMATGLDLMAGTDPKTVLSDARTIIVLAGAILPQELSSKSGTVFRSVLSGRRSNYAGWTGCASQGIPFFSKTERHQFQSTL